MKTAKRRYPTPALEKGLDILELFTREPSGLTKSDVARRLNRTVSEIFRMLLCLEERGYIARVDENDRFQLTLKMFRMSLEYPPTKRLVSDALPIMQELVHVIHQSCHLGVLELGQVVIVAQTDSPISPGFYVKAGAIVDLMHAATGHVILAHLPADARERAIETWQQLSERRVPKTSTTTSGKSRSRATKNEPAMKYGGDQRHLSDIGRTGQRRRGPHGALPRKDRGIDHAQRYSHCIGESESEID